MPITVTPTEPGGIWTPGGLVSFAIEPPTAVPVDSSWTVTLEADASGEGGVVWSTGIPGNGTRFGSVHLMSTRPGERSQTQGPLPIEGQPTAVHVELLDAGVTVDSLRVVANWSSTAGIGAQIADQQTAGSQGGLTTEEHGWLDQVQQFVTNTLTFGGTLATQLGAGGILDRPDQGLLTLCDSPITLTGQGSLTRPRPGVGVEAYGLAINVVDSPDGSGLLVGVIREFTVRTVQFVAFYKPSTLAGDYPSEIFDSRAEAETWLWRSPFPALIAYHVTPGFTVQVQWLCLPGPI